MNSAYYNEVDPFAAAWLRNLIEKGAIAPGDVDERSIINVAPEDLVGYRQCHFFAGIGGWSYGLRLAGWPDDKPVWTGSCPCQPFSAAGRRGGINDERHLWPAWFSLIRECRPPVVFGEQVSGTDALAWLDFVCADLEDEAYACAAADLCAAGVGAPHIRQRLWFVGERLDDTTGSRYFGALEGSEGQAWDETRLCLPDEGGGFGELADASCESSKRRSGGISAPQAGERRARPQYGSLFDGPPDGGEAGGLAHADEQRRSGDVWRARPLVESVTKSGSVLGNSKLERPQSGNPAGAVAPPRAGATIVSASPWSEYEWLPCRDGKARPTQSGLFPLAHGVPNRVGRLRAYGNAIVPQVAAEFIRAFMERDR